MKERADWRAETVNAEKYKIKTEMRAGEAEMVCGADCRTFIAPLNICPDSAIDPPT